MPEFRKVNAATYSPTSCVCCGDHEGPFLDTQVELPGYGWVYICASNENRPGCLQQMARLDYMHSDEYVTELRDEMADLEERNNALQDELAEVVRGKSVKVGTLQKALGLVDT